MKKKVTISWSGGKDSALSLYKILQDDIFDVVGIHTVLNKETRRVGMHGIREELMDRQANAIGLPLTKLFLEASEEDEAYKKLMQDFYRQCASTKVDGVVFGDIFLEDLRTFRENLLHPAGLQAIFPLWQMDSNVLLQEFIDVGFKTLVCSANAKHFSSNQLGKTIDRAFIASLPSGVDPCGENGEFHTFVFDGPIFKQPVGITLGEVIEKRYQYKMLKEDGSVQHVSSAFWFQEIR